MNRRETIDRITRDPEEQILLAHILDVYHKAEDRNIPLSTAFLSPQECSMAETLLQNLSQMNTRASGGYEGAERKMLFFLPDYMEDIPEEISVLRASWYRDSHLTHRDLLGSLMGMGIERKCIGDILVSAEENSADILVTREIADYLLENYRQAGRVSLNCRLVPLQHIHIPKQNCTEMRETVASMRLDGIISAVFRISRSKADELVTSGKVQVNWKDVVRTDYQVSTGDIITCRGYGKAEIVKTGSLTKKGRIPVEMKRYL